MRIPGPLETWSQKCQGCSPVIRVLMALAGVGSHCNGGRFSKVVRVPEGGRSYMEEEAASLVTWVLGSEPQNRALPDPGSRAAAASKLPSHHGIPHCR